MFLFLLEIYVSLIIVNIFLLFISLWIYFKADKKLDKNSLTWDNLNSINLCYCINLCIIPFMGFVYVAIAFQIKKEIEKEFCEKVMNKLMGE